METTQITNIQKEASLVENVRKKAGISRYFYVIIGALALVFVLAGFSRTYFIPVYSGTFTGRTILHIHGVVYFLWFILAIVQPMLVQRKKIRIHRNLGIFSVFLALLMTVMGTALAIASAKWKVEGGADIFEAKAFLMIPISDMIMFPVFIGLALLNLKNRDAHKRFMVLASLAILPAAFGRLFLIIGLTLLTPISIILAFLLQEFILLFGMIHDWFTRKKIHAVYIWGGIPLMVIHLIRYPLGNTFVWQSIAGWLTGL